MNDALPSTQPKYLKIGDLPRSIKGKEWHLRESNAPLALTFSQKYDVPEVVGRMMALRDVALEQADTFLQPSLRNSLPDPSHLLDMDKAVDRLTQAIDKKEKITVFGDYDVDGSTSAAVLIRFFRAIGHDAIDYYIPDRLEEGYGPNVKAMHTIADRGTQILVTVDCGAVAFDALSEAKKLGMESIVIDHHIGSETLLEAAAVVNPNRLDETTEHRNLAAVGVCFLLVVGLNRALKNSGFFDSHNTLSEKGVDLLQFLDIVALGTVCDVMTLTGLNRAYVSQGLKMMAKWQNIGLKKLVATASDDLWPTVYTLGFLLGPRINAGGRIGKSDLGVRLLITEDEFEAEEIAAALDTLNKERQAIEKQALEEADKLADNAGNQMVVLVNDKEAGSYWHPGVIGIMAGRIKERLNKPVGVISMEETAGGVIGKGSMRSVSGVDIGAAIGAAKMAGILEAGGGHAMAGGFSVKAEKIPDFQAFLEARLGENIATHLEKNTWNADLALPVPAITLELLHQLKRLEPYGMGNPEPRIILGPCTLYKAKVVGENHIMCIVGDRGAYSQSGGLKAMAFRSLDEDMGKMLLSSIGKEIYLAGKAKLNVWQGVEKPEFIADDAIFI